MSMRSLPTANTSQSRQRALLVPSKGSRVRGIEEETREKNSFYFFISVILMSPFLCLMCQYSRKPGVGVTLTDTS